VKPGAAGVNPGAGVGVGAGETPGNTGSSFAVGTAPAKEPADGAGGVPRASPSGRFC